MKSYTLGQSSQQQDVDLSSVYSQLLSLQNIIKNIQQVQSSQQAEIIYLEREIDGIVQGASITQQVDNITQDIIVIENTTNQIINNYNTTQQQISQVYENMTYLQNHTDNALSEAAIAAGTSAVTAATVSTLQNALQSQGSQIAAQAADMAALGANVAANGAAAAANAAAIGANAAAIAANAELMAANLLAMAAFNTSAMAFGGASGMASALSALGALFGGFDNLTQPAFVDQSAALLALGDDHDQLEQDMIAKINELQNTINTMNTKDSMYESRITILEMNNQFTTAIPTMQSNLQYLQAMVDGNTTLIQDQADRLIHVETQVTTLQTDVSQLKTSVTALQTNTTSLQTQITQLRNDMTTARQDINSLISLTSPITKMQTDITKLQNNVTQAQEYIGLLQSDVTTHTSQIATMQSQLTSNSNSLTVTNTSVTTLRNILSVSVLTAMSYAVLQTNYIQECFAVFTNEFVAYSFMADRDQQEALDYWAFPSGSRYRNVPYIFYASTFNLNSPGNSTNATSIMELIRKQRYNGQVTTAAEAWSCLQAIQNDLISILEVTTEVANTSTSLSRWSTPSNLKLYSMGTSLIWTPI